MNTTSTTSTAADRLASAERNLASAILQAAGQLDTVGTDTIGAALVELERAAEGARLRLAQAASRLARTLDEVAGLAQALTTEALISLQRTPEATPEATPEGTDGDGAAVSSTSVTIVTPGAAGQSREVESTTVAACAPVGEDDAQADAIVDLAATEARALDELPMARAPSSSPSSAGRGGKGRGKDKGKSGP